MTPPAKLITFAISHYCEKARWALDWHNIAYQEVCWPPGLHVVLARRAGAKDTSVPLLIIGDEIVQGSTDIIDWAEQNSRRQAAQCDDTDPQSIERRLDDGIGVNVRRLVYAHMLPKHGQLVKSMLFSRLPARQRIAGKLMWPVTRRLIARAYQTDGDACAQARNALEDEFTWLETLITDERPYLSGTSFSRVDLTAASLLAPLARPAAMPLYRESAYSPALDRIIEGWSARPLMCWVRSVYGAHR